MEENNFNKNNLDKKEKKSIKNLTFNKKFSNKKNLIKKLKNKKIEVILLCIALFVLISLLVFFIYNLFHSKHLKASFENSFLNFATNNEKVIFSITNCTFFSSSDTKNKVSSATNFTIENLYQYTDMAFFINNNSDTLSFENTLKNVYINNIKYTHLPNIGKPDLYYKNINNFAKSDIIDHNLIQNNLNFEISSNDNLNFDTPSLYNNCASPITLSFVNSNIKTDYTITNTSNPVTYNGSLLKRFNIPLNTIETSLSFDIYITNNLNQEFKTNVYFDIPLQSKDGQTTIYDGKYSSKQDTNYIFYRYK